MASKFRPPKMKLKSIHTPGENDPLLADDGSEEEKKRAKKGLFTTWSQVQQKLHLKLQLLIHGLLAPDNPSE